MSHEQQSTPEPDAALRSLDRLVGRWRLTGEAEGEIEYEWLEGNFFLLQRVDMQQSGMPVKGLEVIGRERPFGAPGPSEDIKSRFYGSQGETFDYVYEMEGDTLTIWGGEKGSPAYFRGEFSADGNVLDGGWVYPGGGGYRSTATRVG